MKKIVSMLLVFAMILSFGVVFADDEISVEIDGVKQSYDVMPVIINGRTLVPMRAIFEAFGAEVFWDETNRSVAASKDSTAVLLKIDSDVATLNGKEVTLDSPATIINGRTMVPVRFISEALGNKVDWNGDTRTVIITSPKTESKADKLYKELNLTNIVLDEKEYFSNARFNNNQYGTAEYITSGIDGYNNVVRVETTEVPQKTANFIYKYTKTVEGFNEGDSLLMVLTFRTLSSDAPDGLGKLQVQLEETTNFTKAIFEVFTAGKEWTTYYMPVPKANGYTATGIRFGFNKQVIELAEYKYINCVSLKVNELPNNTFEYIAPPEIIDFKEGDNMDIFICLGQSNMQGAGTVASSDIYEYKSSYLFNADSKWEKLGYESSQGSDILGFNRYSNIMPNKTGNKLGPLDYMSREIEAKLPDKKIGYVVNARGGVSIKTYLPGSEEGYYEMTLQRCKEAQKYGTIKGLIWDQGEADASKDQYIEWLTTMVEAFKKDLGLTELPVIAGELLNNFPERIKFNQNLKANEEALDLRVVSSEGLTDKGDTAHFSDDSYREFGRRYAKVLLEKIYNIK